MTGPPTNASPDRGQHARSARAAPPDAATPRRRHAWWALAAASVCGPAGASEPALLRNATLPGRGPVDVLVQDGRILAVHPAGHAWEGTPSNQQDLSGKCLTAGFVDSHVHLAYRPEDAAMVSGGVAGVVDLGAPLATLASAPAIPGLERLASGPMITAFGGYPTQSWGRDGYGVEVLGPRDATAAVDRLADAGAQLIKVPFAKGPVLTKAELEAVVARAHARGLKVVAHALTEESANRAGAAGCDVLAHTPTEPLSDATVALWADGAVISTLKAFGSSQAAIDNLKRLRAAGATVLYGTDFGNSTTAGIDPAEVALLSQAGLGPADLLAAATTVPTAYWGLKTTGSVEAGKSATLWIGACDCAWCPRTP